MSRSRPAAGGGKIVEVEPERLVGWFDRFSARNDGVVDTVVAADTVVVTSGNGTTAVVRVPFPPLLGLGKYSGLAIRPLVEHLGRPRLLGLLLVRLGSHSVGIVRDGEVLVSRTRRHLVHGRSAAGGWSQQRFARRRDNQAKLALQSAADDAVEVLGARAVELEGVVLGGDRRALDELRKDRRLTVLFDQAVARVLDVPEPRWAVLAEAAQRARAVEIHITR